MVPASCGADLRLASRAIVSDACAGGGGGSGNGILDAGEDATVSVTLQNIGEAPASGVTAALSTTAPDVVVTRPNASFPSAAKGMTATSAPPHFGVWIGPTVACGTVIPFTLQVSSAQGSWARAFTLTTGSGSGPCAQTVCTGALPVEDGTAPNLLLVSRGSGTSLDLTFGLGCHAVDSTVYWGQASGHMTGVPWTGAACGFGAISAATVDPGSSPPGALIYLVVVPQNGEKEGSYGRSSSGTERPGASGLGACSRPQQLGGVCN